MNIFEKLLEIQTELKAPKGQYNSFGKYRYRSCEDILEAVKPLLKKVKCSLIITDGIEFIGERYYLKAEAILRDLESNEFINNIAYAREAENKSGMDVSQITGTASSYARKYALNGLFLIDDTKDVDQEEIHEESKQEALITDQQKEIIKKITEKMGKPTDEKKLNKMTMKQASDFIMKNKGVLDGSN